MSVAWIPMEECPICQKWAAKFGPCGYHTRHPSGELDDEDSEDNEGDGA